MRILRALVLTLAACGPTTSATPGTAVTTTSDGSTTGASTTTTTDSPTSHPFVDTTSSDSSGAGPSTTTETSHAFIMDPDPPACDLFAQDCPPGEKCSFFSDDDIKGGAVEACVPVAADPRLPGELCHFNEPGMGLDDCAIGSYCIPYYSDNAGKSVCVALCEADTYACPEPLDCAQTWFLFWCQFDCHPLLQDCAEGLACSWEVCSPVSPGYFDRPTGETCDYSLQCVPKSLCAAAVHVPDCAGERCCTELCDLQAPAPCGLPGQTCQPPPPDDIQSESLPDGVGVCMLP